jgi:hypothetical protein
MRVLPPEEIAWLRRDAASDREAPEIPERRYIQQKRQEVAKRGLLL